MNIGKTFLAIGIAIVLTIFVAYGISVIYERPVCDCHLPTATERPADYYQSSEYQQCNSACRVSSRISSRIWEVNNVIILGAIGLIAIILGFFLINVESIGSGILGGGILLIIYNVLRYWGSLNKYLRLGLLAVALIILIGFGYWIFERKKDKK